MRRVAALPFVQRRSSDAYDGAGVTSTTHTVHGLLHLEGERLTVQWRRATKVARVGEEIRTDEETGPVHETVIPLERLAGAAVRRRWWGLGSPRVTLTAADLRAFEALAATDDALRLDHPAELRVHVRRRDALAAEEFAAELALALAERTARGGPSLEEGRGADGALPGSAGAGDPRPEGRAPEASRGRDTPEAPDTDPDAP